VILRLSQTRDALRFCSSWTSRATSPKSTSTLSYFLQFCYNILDATSQAHYYRQNFGKITLLIIPQWMTQMLCLASLLQCSFTGYFLWRNYILHFHSFFYQHFQTLWWLAARTRNLVSSFEKMFDLLQTSFYIRCCDYSNSKILGWEIVLAIITIENSHCNAYV